LPHAQVELPADDANPSRSGEHTRPGPGEGRICVRASSLFLGYWPEPARAAGEGFLTSDRGRMDAGGRLTVLGRIDALINSGGEKIDPATVEAAIRATGFVRDVAVCGVPDRDWGEAVVAIVSGARPEDEPAM